MSFRIHGYYLTKLARGLYRGWAYGYAPGHGFYEYTLDVCDLATLPPTSLVYVDGVKVRR